MRVKITSDGTKSGLKVTDVDTGSEIPDCIGVYLQFKDREDPIAAIEVIQPKVEVEADAQFIGCCEHCGAQKELSDSDIKPELKKKALPEVDYQLSPCFACNVAPGIKFHSEDPDENTYTEIICPKCHEQVDAPNFKEAKSKWELYNNAR